MKLQVLLIDDSPVMRQALADAIEACRDARVRSAGSGSEGLALLEEEPADVVVVDARMPGLGGDEVCREIRSRPDPPPVIMLSAYDEAGFAAEAEAAGAALYIQKSDGLGPILDALERLTS